MASDTARMVGEWVGSGEMTVGPAKGEIAEYLSLETTDIDGCLSYLRKSRIVFPDRTLLHNELGYMKPDEAELILSRGSYVILAWDERQRAYLQRAGSADSRNMVRKVTFPDADKMVWDNEMEVQHGGHWVKHTAITTFTSIATVSGS